MTLSIVIPAKNEEKYLPELLKSIKKQTFQGYEIIVADNESVDRTVEIARSYNCKIIKGGLPGRARNLGVKAAKGEIILFLDADTELESDDFLKSALEEFELKKLGIAVPLAYVRGNRLDKLYYAFWNFLVRIFQDISPLAGGWCVFTKKKLHDAIKGFNEEISLGEDSDYAKRAAKFGKFGIIHSVKAKVSPRRFQKEGHLKVALQVLASGLYWAFRGKIDRKNRFGYKFDIYK